MHVFYADHQEVELPEGHRFPMGKYRRLRELLCERGILTADELQASGPAPLAAIRAVHAPRYVDGVLAGDLPREEIKRLGFPWSQALVRRSLASVGGTLSAARQALRDGLSGNLAGGTHHAYRDFGSGFCVFNDLVITARALLDEGAVGRVLVFDVDVHQGDGTAAMCTNEPRVFTCSLHGAKNFPARKQQSDLDVPLPDGADDLLYLDQMDRALDTCLASGKFDLALVQGGVDGLESDRLGRLSLTQAGLAERDQRLLGRLRSEGLPIALTLGGGYGQPIETSLEAHLGTYRAAKDLQNREGRQSGGCRTG